METPSSTRVTRSHIFAASNNNNNISSNMVSVSKNIEDSGMGVSKSRQRSGKQQDRSVLIDITNDSPIVGVASSCNLETPLSSIAKQRASQAKNTPESASGEALLRGQVKTLLQKVEEEAELSKLSLESRPFLRLVNSPIAVLAPPPANTPQIPNFSGDGGLASVIPSPVVEEQLISQVVNYMSEGKREEENGEHDKSVITRSLLMDFSEKSETCDTSECCSELSYEEVGSREKASTEDDVSSNWSVQVNASTHDEDEEETAEIEEEEDFEMLEEVCEGMNKISVNERVDPKWEGKHTTVMMRLLKKKR